MAITKTVNLYREPYDVYIGRGSYGSGMRASKWSNPFIIGRDGDRSRVIAKYRQHLYSQINSGVITSEDICQLDGLHLGCFCHPQGCHGDVLVDLIEYYKSQSC